MPKKILPSSSAPGKLGFLLFLLMFLPCYLSATSDALAQTHSLEDVLIQYGNVRDFTLSPSGGGSLLYNSKSPGGSLCYCSNSNDSWTELEIDSFSGKV